MDSMSTHSSSSTTATDSLHFSPIVRSREVETNRMATLKGSDGHRAHSASPRSSPYDPKMRVVRRRQFICIHNDCRKPRPNKKSNVETHVWTQHVRRGYNLPNAPYVANLYQHLVTPFMMPVDEVVQLEKEAAPLFVLANATPLSEYLSKIGKTDYIEKFAYIPRKQGASSLLSTPVHSDDDASSVAGSFGVRSREVTPAPHEEMHPAAAHSDDDSVVPEVRGNARQPLQRQRPVLKPKDSSLDMLSSAAAASDNVWRPW